MAFISFHEVFDIVLMTALIAYLFNDLVRINNTDTLWTRFKRAAIIISPAIVLHELAHKFSAMAFGLEAVFHAFYANSTTLFLGGIAILAKLTNFGLVFLVPGYVQICPMGGSCSTLLASNPLWGSIIAFAGPAVHLTLWLLGIYMLQEKRAKKLSENKLLFWSINKRINMFLFILNMLPIPGIDGWHVYTGIIGAL